MDIAVGTAEQLIENANEYMTSTQITAIFYLASFLFIFALGGLANQETAPKGNWYGVLSMILAIFITFFTSGFLTLSNFEKFGVAFIIGGIIGFVLAYYVEMINMPQMVAMLHSFVGIAATIVGYANFGKEFGFDGLREQSETAKKEENSNLLETFIGVFIGTITFAGSVVAWGKLNGNINSKPLVIGQGNFRHWLNIGCILVCVILCYLFCSGKSLNCLIIMTIIALFIGYHLVMAIGGADMPVVVSMLNSYSGWATSASGFMIKNQLLIISGALIGSSGAILSYIMCKAMNRSFISVISGGFGLEVAHDGPVPTGEMKEAKLDEVVKDLTDAKSVIVVPGYGMAVSRAQKEVGDLIATLRKMGKKCRFCIHPVAGRLPGHMNVLLAEARVPYDIVLEMDHINDDFDKTDVVIIIGANDIVNPDALDNPKSPISGMPVCHVWKAKRVIVNKRGKGMGYAAIENPLFFKENTRMFYGDAQAKVKEIIAELGKRGVDVVKKEPVVTEQKESQQEQEVEQKYEDLLPYLTNVSQHIYVPKESEPLEKRVAITPAVARQLIMLGFAVHVQRNAGLSAGFTDAEYKKNGCEIKTCKEVWENSEILIKIRPPMQNDELGYHEADAMQSTKVLISYIYPLQGEELVQRILKNKPQLSVLALDCTPRITRAQKLDTLSSTTNLSGYRAVLEAFSHLPRFANMQMTAAGKIAPAKVFIIGCGVAGLAAIGIARAMGAIVYAFDSREVCKEQVESLGGEFVKMDFEESGAGSGGYGKEMSAAYYHAQREMVNKMAKKVDVIISTALIPGKKAPTLIYEEGVRAMRPGSVIVDMAAEMGGNCELTKKGQVYIEPESQVKIIGLYDYPSKMAAQSSELFAVNMHNLLIELIKKSTNPTHTAKDFSLDLNDEIVRGMIVVHNGEYIFQKPITGPPQPQQQQKTQEQQPKKEDKVVVSGGTEHGGGGDNKYIALGDGDTTHKKEAEPTPFRDALKLIIVAIIIAYILSKISDDQLIQQIGLFVLAIFTGYQLIWQVTPALHTPLMSVTNAISGIIIVGCMQTQIQHQVDIDNNLFTTYSWCAVIGIFFASINIVGGFYVSHKMLAMFKRNY